MFSRRSVLTEAALQLAGGAALINRADGSGGLTLSNVNTAAVPADMVSVLEFGADPTGRVDCSDAVSRAIEHCFSAANAGLPKPLYFPPGRFLIRRNNLFHSWPPGQPILSWTIAGAGRRTTTLVFKPIPEFGLDRHYLYDGMFDATAMNPNQTLIGLRMLDLAVEFDCAQMAPASKVSCFRQFGSSLSNGPEQNWTFENCLFRGDERYPDKNGSILEIAGDANGSENAFIGCRAIMFEHVIDCLNPQAVNHLSLFCHWEVIVGDMFRFVRGGNLALYGGSLILNNLNDAQEWKSRTTYAPGASVFYDGREYRTNAGGVSGDREFGSVGDSHFDGSVQWTLQSDKSAYLLRVGGDLTGQINTFLISGARVELRSNRSKLLAGGDLNTAALITFENIAVQPVLGGPRHTIELAESSASVRFVNCKLSRAAKEWDDPFSVIFGAGPGPRARQDGARIALDGCVVSENIHALSVWGENSSAMVVLNNCTIGYRNAEPALAQSRVTEVNGISADPKRGTAATGIARCTRALFVPFDYWPGSLSKDQIQLNLPSQAAVLEMRFIKRSKGGVLDKYQIVVRDEAGSVIFKSDPVNLGGPFEITTPRFQVQPHSAGVRLTILGSAQPENRVPADVDDSIVLEWI